MAAVALYGGAPRATVMGHHLLIGMLALFVAITLLTVGRPNNRGESPRLLRVPAAPRLYVLLVLLFAAIGAAELIAWWLVK